MCLHHIANYMLTCKVQRVFFGRLWVALKRACFLWSGGSDKNRLFTTDVQNDALHA